MAAQNEDLGQRTSKIYTGLTRDEIVPIPEELRDFRAMGKVDLQVAYDKVIETNPEFDIGLHQYLARTESSGYSYLCRLELAHKNSSE